MSTTTEAALPTQGHATPGRLQASDLPIHSLQLPCARCGRTQAAHGGMPPDCEGFVRPLLPSGHAYVDELAEGDWFRFLSRNGQPTARVARHQPLDLDEETGLLQIRSAIPGTADVVHLVQRNTIVVVPPKTPPAQVRVATGATGSLPVR